MRHVYLFREDNEAVHWTVPVYLAAVAEGVPRKDAVGVGKQQPVYAQVASDGKQSVGIAQPWVGKSYDFFVESVYHSANI